MILKRSDLTVLKDNSFNLLFSYAIRYGALSNCINCPGGYYCLALNMTDKGPECDAGFYCTEKSPEAAPVGEVWGDECPTGQLIGQNNNFKLSI
jgi:hypothetical protein